MHAQCRKRKGTKGWRQSRTNRRILQEVESLQAFLRHHCPLSPSFSWDKPRHLDQLTTKRPNLPSLSLPCDSCQPSSSTPRVVSKPSLKVQSTSEEWSWEWWRHWIVRKSKKWANLLKAKATRSSKRHRTFRTSKMAGETSTFRRKTRQCRSTSRSLKMKTVHQTFSLITENCSPI